MAKSAVITDNPSGLILAYFLENSGHDVTILDIDDHLSLNNIRAGTHLPILPATDTTLAGVQRLEQLLQQTLIAPQQEGVPMSLIDGEPIPFVGFGDSQSSAVYPVSKYNYFHFSKILHPWSELLIELHSRLSSKVLPFCEITGMETEKNRLLSVTINGQQKIVADQFFFNCDPRILPKFIPKTEISSRIRTKLAQSPAWARLSLQFQHEKNSFTANNTIFLPASNTEDPPLVGRLETHTLHDGMSLCSSIWETYIKSDSVEDSEALTHLIRLLKKRVRRCVPGVGDKSKESLSLETLSAGDFAWIKQISDLTDVFSNTHISSPLMENEIGVAAQITCAENSFTHTLLPRKNIHLSPSLLTPNSL